MLQFVNICMCTAMNSITDEDWNSLVKKVGRLETTFNEWKGSMLTIKWFLGISTGLGILILSALLSFGNYTINSINENKLAMALQAQRYEMFMNQGPRFTPEDYYKNIQIDKAEIYKTVEQMIREHDKGLKGFKNDM